MAIKRTGKKSLKRKQRKLSGKRFQKGTVGNFFVFGILALLIVLGITAVGGLPSQMAPTSGQVVMAITPTQGVNYNNLQLKTFGYVTIAPTPTPATDSLCTNSAINTEPIILVGYYPGPGQTVGSTGQVKVWVGDERPPYVAPGEQINISTGAVTKPGDRTAKASDNLLYEPALYIAPASPQNNGAAHFPDVIKGQFNNNPQSGGFLNPTVVNGPKIDTIPAGSAPTQSPNQFGWGGGLNSNQYTAEYLWNVSNLGLSSGTYQAEFVIHDGDFDQVLAVLVFRFNN